MREKFYIIAVILLILVGIISVGAYYIGKPSKNFDFKKEISAEDIEFNLFTRDNISFLESARVSVGSFSISEGIFSAKGDKFPKILGCLEFHPDYQHNNVLNIKRNRIVISLEYHSESGSYFASENNIGLADTKDFEVIAVSNLRGLEILPEQMSGDAIERITFYELKDSAYNPLNINSEPTSNAKCFWGGQYKEIAVVEII